MNQLIIVRMVKRCSLQTVILASNPPHMGGQVLSHCRSAWERRQICHQQRTKRMDG